MTKFAAQKWPILLFASIGSLAPRVVQAQPRRVPAVERNHPFVLSAFASILTRTAVLPSPHSTQGWGWNFGLSAGGQFVLRPRWRLQVRGSVQFPRMMLGETDTAEQMFHYVAGVEVVARYRFARRGGWYSGVGGALQMVLSRALLGRGDVERSAVGGSAVMIGELGATFGEGYQCDWGLRLQAGVPLERWGAVVDLGMYGGYHW